MKRSKRGMETSRPSEASHKSKSIREGEDTEKEDEPIGLKDNAAEAGEAAGEEGWRDTVSSVG
jgi:hypothetical protein